MKHQVIIPTRDWMGNMQRTHQKIKPLLRRLVNLKLKESDLVMEYLDDFQSMANLLVGVDYMVDDERQPKC